VLRTTLVTALLILPALPVLAEGVIIPPPCSQGACNPWPYKEPFDPDLLARQLAKPPHRPLKETQVTLPLCTARCQQVLKGTHGYFGCFHPGAGKEASTEVRLRTP
jgi:hypothetical protein